MSISLQISGDNIPEAKWKNIPVATESEFEKYWMPISNKLNLEYVPLFRFGINIDSETLNDTLRELQLIKSEVAKQPAADDGYKNLILRIDALIGALPDFVSNYQTVFIG